MELAASRTHQRQSFISAVQYGDPVASAAIALIQWPGLNLGLSLTSPTTTIRGRRNVKKANIFPCNTKSLKTLQAVGIQNDFHQTLNWASPDIDANAGRVQVFAVCSCSETPFGRLVAVYRSVWLGFYHSINVWTVFRGSLDIVNVKSTCPHPVTLFTFRDSNLEVFNNVSVVLSVAFSVIPSSPISLMTGGWPIVDP